MSTYIDKVANMRRVVIYYTETGHIYLEGVWLGPAVDGWTDVIMAFSRDMDFPSYIQITGVNLTDNTAMDRLTEYLSVRPEWKDLTVTVLDKDTQFYDPRTQKYFDSQWKAYEISVQGN